MGEQKGASVPTQEVRAQFIETNDTRLGGDSKLLFKDDSSPLLSCTPPNISKSLVLLYPYLIVLNEALSILTWTGENIWRSILLICVFLASVLYFNTIVKYFGHIIIISTLLGYSKMDSFVRNRIGNEPSLEDIIKVMDKVSIKFDLLLSPFYNFKEQDVLRLLFTMTVLSPLYFIITWLFLPPWKFVLVGGLFVLTYHSPWAKVTRRLLWKFKTVRLLVFYVTGLDLSLIHI